MDYSFVVSNMTWSHSRLTTFEDCPYAFYLKYILCENGKNHFFAEYGSFIHLLIQRYLTGEIDKKDLPGFYLTLFRAHVTAKAPNSTIFNNYFRHGLEYFQDIKPLEPDILAVEQEMNFNINNHDFIGFVDIVFKKDDDLYVIDNKSRDLKPRSGKAKALKTDKELDKYLRQLYLYSIPIEKLYGKYPDKLVFNCFRKQNQIVEKFNIDALNETKKWAIDTIETISKTTKWTPKIDLFRCQNLCDLCDQCEYFQMYRGGK